MAFDWNSNVTALLVIGSTLWFAVLNSFCSVARVAFMMSDDDDSNAAGTDTVKKVIRKALHVSPAQSVMNWMEPLRFGSSLFDQRQQLIPERISESSRNPVVMAQNVPDVTPDGRMIRHVHRRRSSRTLSTNSSCSIGVTSPLSNS